ncbi:MAG TPA: hypothetical protein VIM99_05035, partial [Blastocatellia bacterium]
MTRNANEERTMTRYLLGVATEEECVEIEGRFLRDAEYLKRLRAIECEIIDDYARGDLPPAERRSFERRALASPQGREQIARARKFRAMLDQIAVEAREPAPSIPREHLWKKLRARFFMPAPAFLYAIASLFLIGGLWLLREDSLSQRRIAELGAELDLARRNEKDLQERLAAERDERQLLTSQLENEKSRLAAERSRNARMLQRMRRIPTVNDGDFVELALTSGIERNSGNPRRLSIPMNVRMVKLQLELDPSVNHRSYRVELNTAGGAQTWVQAGLVARESEWGRFVTLIMPTR